MLAVKIVKKKEVHGPRICSYQFDIIYLEGVLSSKRNVTIKIPFKSFCFDGFTKSYMLGSHIRYKNLFESCLPRYNCTAIRVCRFLSKAVLY